MCLGVDMSWTHGGHANCQWLHHQSVKALQAITSTVSILGTSECWKYVKELVTKV